MNVQASPRRLASKSPITASPSPHKSKQTTRVPTPLKDRNDNRTPEKGETCKPSILHHVSMQSLTIVQLVYYILGYVFPGAFFNKQKVSGMKHSLIALYACPVTCICIILACKSFNREEEPAKPEEHPPELLPVQGHRPSSGIPLSACQGGAFPGGGVCG